MTVYILEGSDATGKTTLAKQLSDKLELLTIKGSSFEQSDCTNEELYKHFKKVANLDNVIVDRHIYSNRIYATLYKDYAILSDKQRTKIENIFKQDALVIYLTADEETIIKRLKQRGDKYVTPDKVAPILNLYQVAISDALDNNVTVLYYDTSILSTEEIVEDILNYPESKGILKYEK